MIDKIRINFKGGDYSFLKSKITGLKETTNHTTGDKTFTGSIENVFVCIKENKDGNTLYLDFSPHIFIQGTNLNNISFDEAIEAIEMLGLELDLDDIKDFKITSLDIGFNQHIGYPIPIFLSSLVLHKKLEQFHRFNNGLYFENDSVQLRIYDKGLEIGNDENDLLRTELRVKKPLSLLKATNLEVADLENPKIQSNLISKFKEAIDELVVRYKPNSFKVYKNEALNWVKMRDIILENYLSDSDNLNDLFNLIDAMPPVNFSNRNNKRIIKNEIIKRNNGNLIKENRKHRTLEHLKTYLDNIEC